MSVQFFRDTGTVFSREFAPVLREPLALLFTMGQPLLFLFLFGPLLGERGVSRARARHGSGSCPAS